MPHLRADTLENYFFDRATPAAVIRTEEHLLVCDACRNRLDEFAAFMQSLKEACSESCTASSAA